MDNIKNTINKYCDNKFSHSNYYGIKYILAIGDIHGDFTILLHILLKAEVIRICDRNSKNAIHINYKEFEHTDIIDYYVKVNKHLNNYIIIQVGDQLDIRQTVVNNRMQPLDGIDIINNDDKIVEFINILRNKIEELKKNYYFVSLFGNHEINNISKDYNYAVKGIIINGDNKDRENFLIKNKKNYLCNYKLIVNVNDNYHFIHSGLIKEHIDKYFSKYILKNMSMREKIKIFNYIFIYLLKKNYLKMSKLTEIVSVRDYDRNRNNEIYKYEDGVRYIKNDNYKGCDKLQEYKDEYEFNTLRHLVIGHNAGYNTDNTKCKCKTTIWHIDNLKSRAFSKNSTYNDKDVAYALLFNTENNSYISIY